jgi:hypothetical protein
MSIELRPIGFVHTDAQEIPRHWSPLLARCLVKLGIEQEGQERVLRLFIVHKKRIHLYLDGRYQVGHPYHMNLDVAPTPVRSGCGANLVEYD